MRRTSIRTLTAWLIVCLSATLSTYADAPTWTQTNGPYGGFVFSVHATAGGTVYAGTGSGVLYRSDDDGATWDIVNARVASGDLLALTVFDDALYVGTDGDGVLRSYDRGELWEDIGDGLESPNVQALAAAHQTLFAGTLGRGVFRWDGEARAWTAVNDGLPSPLVLSLFAHRGHLYAGTWGRGVLRSADGKTWEPTGLTHGEIVSLGRAGGHTSGAVLAGSHTGGVMRSPDGGATWTPVNIGERVVWAFTEHHGIAYAASEDGSVLSSADAGVTWVASPRLTHRAIRAISASDDAVHVGSDGSGVFRRVDDDDGPWTQSGLRNSIVMSLHARDGAVYAGTAFNGVVVSRDGGESWRRSNDGLTRFEIWAMLRVGGDLYAGTGGEGLFVSHDDAKTWTPTGLRDRNVRGLMSHGAALYASTEDGGVFRSDDATTWQPRNEGLTQLHVPALAGLGGRIYAGTGGDGVFTSSNGGVTWSAIPDGLEHRHVISLAAHDGAIHAGTSGGVYRLDERASRWSATGLAGVWAFTTHEAVLYAGAADGVYRWEIDADRWTAAVGMDGYFIRALAPSDGGLYAGTLGNGVFLGKQAAPSTVEDAPPSDAPGLR